MHISLFQFPTSLEKLYTVLPQQNLFCLIQDDGTRLLGDNDHIHTLDRPIHQTVFGLFDQDDLSDVCSNIH